MKNSTSQTSLALTWLIALAVLLRLITSGLYPLSDLTEARYAEIARKMVASGDWITPWYAEGVPFWGKPPLSTWLTAGSMQLFGVNEWAARLPHFLCAALAAWLMWRWLRLYSSRAAQLGLALLIGSVLYFVAAGAVMTDMALLVGLVLAMRGFWFAISRTDGFKAAKREGWLFFVGLGLGLLAKGPVVLILAGLPISLWILVWVFSSSECNTPGVGRKLIWLRKRLPWLSGLALMLLIAAPWYVLAEWRTPGFLDYFLIGEHWQRFTQPGWDGDRYGTAHVEPRGTVWLFALAACLPWSLLLLFASWPGKNRNAAAQEAALQDGYPLGTGSLRWYLWAWALAPCIFFTISRNTLWTYVLPGLPAAAALAALWLTRNGQPRRVNVLVGGGLLATSTLFLAATLALPGMHNSAHDVVAAYEIRRGHTEPIVFIGTGQYSAAFYTRGQAHIVSSQLWQNASSARQALEQVRPSQGNVGSYFLALQASQWKRWATELGPLAQDAGRHGPYRLLRVTPTY